MQRAALSGGPFLSRDRKTPVLLRLEGAVVLIEQELFVYR